MKCKLLETALIYQNIPIESVCAQFMHKDETARFDGSAALVTRQYNAHFYAREQCSLVVSVTLKLINQYKVIITQGLLTQYCKT